MESPVLWAGPKGWLGQSRMGWGNRLRFAPISPFGSAPCMPAPTWEPPPRGDGARCIGLRPQHDRGGSPHGSGSHTCLGRNRNPVEKTGTLRSCPPWRAIQCPVLWAGLFTYGGQTLGSHSSRPERNMASRGAGTPAPERPGTIEGVPFGRKPGESQDPAPKARGEGRAGSAPPPPPALRLARSALWLKAESVLTAGPL
jgi:hypothetical protein